MRLAPKVKLTPEQTSSLEQWTCGRKTPVRLTKKLEAVVGLYLNPPESAIVLCVDEKSQVQALDRTQPGLPLKKGGRKR